MKVNDFPNEEIKTVDWNYVVSNEGIYEWIDDSRVYVVNVDSLEGVVLVYNTPTQTLEVADTSWHDDHFIPLPNATLIFDVKE